MTNPNPFLPQGSLLELQNRRRSRLKLVVFCTLALSVTGLVAMLIQGCKREKPEDLNPPPLDLSSNTAPVIDTNLPPPSTNNLGMMPSPLAQSNTIPTPMPMPAPMPEPPAAGSTYTIASGDTLGKIAKANHVSLTALEAANPGVDPKKLKPGQKINLPAGGSSSTGATVPAAADSGNIYTVKQGDILANIAKANGVSLKALEAANPGVVPTKLKVGQKLNLPVKAPAPATDAVPASVTTPPPATIPPTAPAMPAPGTAPAH